MADQQLFNYYSFLKVLFRQELVLASAITSKLLAGGVTIIDKQQYSGILQHLYRLCKVFNCNYVAFALSKSKEHFEVCVEEGGRRNILKFLTDSCNYFCFLFICLSTQWNREAACGFRLRSNGGRGSRFVSGIQGLLQVSKMNSGHIKNATEIINRVPVKFRDRTFSELNKSSF